MASTFSVGGWQVEPSSRTLTGPDGDLNLEPKVMQVLVLLAQHQGEVVTKERLLQAVWPDTFVGDEVLSRAISELRRALGDDSKAPRYIQTIPKGGYRLVASVEFHKPAATAVDSPAAVPEVRPTRWLTRVLWGTVILAVASGGRMFVRHGHGNAILPPMTIRPLVTLPGMYGTPSFSPDGTRITFAWTPNQADPHIVVKMVDDESLQELTRGANDSQPAWSPDGRTIAFARDATHSGRDADARSGIYIIPAISGPERRVYAGQVCPGGGPAWAPDGRTLVFSAWRPNAMHCSLYRLSLDTLEIARLTSPTIDQGRAGPPADLSPAFSPDGKAIVFLRYLETYMRDVYVIPSQGGDPRRLTLDDKTALSPVWTSDGMAVLFVSSRGGPFELWRVPAVGGQPERQSVAANAVGVALDREGQRLAYVVQSSGRLHMSAFDLRNPAEPAVRLAESARNEASASFSSDGNRIAFSSDRAGDAYDIWTADADGTHPTRLTFSSGGANGSPRWSPDDEWLAYDSSVDGQFDIYVIRTSGGPPRRLTFDRSNEAGPSWSRDGRWLYFASDRTGKEQIYKIPTTGGAAVPMTKGGGFPGAESADGYLYYSKGRGDYSKSNWEPGVWRIAIGGGAEEPVLTENPRGPYYRFWALIDEGLYYLNTQVEGRPSVEFLRFSTHRTERILELPMSPCPDLAPDLAISPDRHTLVTCFSGPPSSEIFMVENFR